MFSVTDPLEYLLGGWHVTRRLTDVRVGVVGRFDGRADFCPDGDGLAWTEDGRLDWAGAQRRAGRHLFVSRPSNPSGAATAVDVVFGDGRLFHSLDLSSGSDAVTHDCGKDRYDGTFTVQDRDMWAVRWDVAGPSKTLRIVSEYRRLSAQIPCTRHPISP